MWKISLIYADRDNNEAQVSFFTSSATTVAELVSFANTVATALAPLTDGVLVRANVQWSFKRTPGPAASTSNCKRKALLITRDETTGRVGTVSWPSPRINFYAASHLAPPLCLMHRFTPNIANVSITALFARVRVVWQLNSLMPDGLPMPIGITSAANWATCMLTEV